MGSTWLKKTEGGITRLSRWVWIIGVLILACIGGGIAVGWFFTHNNTNTTTSGPLAIGGSADDGTVPLSSSSLPSVSTQDLSSSPHVTPTNTVAKRTWHVEYARATGVPVPVTHDAQDAGVMPLNVSSRHRRVQRRSLY